MCCSHKQDLRGDALPIRQTVPHPVHGWLAVQLAQAVLKWGNWRLTVAPPLSGEHGAQKQWRTDTSSNYV